MSKNKKKKNITLEPHDTAAEEIPSNEANEVSEKGKKNTFGRKV